MRLKKPKPLTAEYMEFVGMPLKGMPDARSRKKQIKKKKMPEARHTLGSSCA